ncbi:hypothetical protein HYS31_02765 [Candidatus Woesearchaeota archaeon]|nr:hypothetical protein [Candidatus Woesearchaeota archaeon]
MTQPINKITLEAKIATAVLKDFSLKESEDWLGRTRFSELGKKLADFLDVICKINGGQTMGTHYEPIIIKNYESESITRYWAFSDCSAKIDIDLSNIPEENKSRCTAEIWYATQDLPKLALDIAGFYQNRDLFQPESLVKTLDADFVQGQ